MVYLIFDKRLEVLRYCFILLFYRPSPFTSWNKLWPVEREQDVCVLNWWYTQWKSGSEQDTRSSAACTTRWQVMTGLRFEL
jgi:hypothetical protein